MVTADWYRHFAEEDARGSSLSYERLALAVSQDDERHGQAMVWFGDELTSA